MGYEYRHLQPAMSFQEIGDELGISHQRAEQIYARAIRKLIQATSRKTVRSLIEESESRRQYAAPTGAARSRENV